uniref:Uncharacterized protein n=1 Tax=Setaria viridis TaxID=4556 RepID=A0A4U6V9K2_SETVI|nr:hypothetical protein SEVIR_3G048800v2 [Setaria viridis]
MTLWGRQWGRKTLGSPGHPWTVDPKTGGLKLPLLPKEERRCSTKERPCTTPTIEKSEPGDSTLRATVTPSSPPPLPHPPSRRHHSQCDDSTGSRVCPCQPNRRPQQVRGARGRWWPANPMKRGRSDLAPCRPPGGDRRPGDCHHSRTASPGPRRADRDPDGGSCD